MGFDGLVRKNFPIQLDWIFRELAFDASCQALDHGTAGRLSKLDRL